MNALRATFAAVLLAFPGVVAADGIQLSLNPGSVSDIFIVDPAPATMTWQMFDLSAVGEVRSYATGMGTDGTVAGYRVLGDGSVVGFSFIASGNVNCNVVDGCQVTADLVGSLALVFFNILMPDTRIETFYGRPLTWDFGDFRIDIQDAPSMLAVNGTGETRLCRFATPASLDALLLTGVQTDCSPLSVEWTPNVSMLPGARAFANSNNWFAVNTSSVTSPTRVIDAYAETPVDIVLANTARVYGLNHVNQVTGVTVADGTGSPQLISFDTVHNTIVNALPTQWTVTSAFGNITVPFTAVWPVAINATRVMLRVGGYGQAIGTGDFAALALTHPFGSGTHDLFYCELDEGCSTAYPIGGGNTLAGGDAESALATQQISSKMQASAADGYLLSDDGVLIGHHDHGHGNGEEPFLLDTTDAAAAPFWWSLTGWSRLRITGRNLHGFLSGYAVREGSSEPSAVVLVPTAAPTAAGVETAALSGGGTTGPWSLLIFSLMAVLRHRRSDGRAGS